MANQWKHKLEHVFLSVTSIGQILITIIFYGNPTNDLIRNLGWVCLWISAIFGWLPIFTFKKYGGVQEKDSYVHTNLLVDRGVYSIVRHPQYLAGILISTGLVLITPSWISGVLGILNTWQYASGAIQEEKDLLAQFGNTYAEYQKRVPRFNFFLGLMRKFFKQS